MASLAKVEELVPKALGSGGVLPKVAPLRYTPAEQGRNAEVLQIVTEM